MLHKVSDFCAEVHSINEQAKELFKAKYITKLPKQQIDNLIQTIQFRMYMLSNDKGAYKNGSR